MFQTKTMRIKQLLLAVLLLAFLPGISQNVAVNSDGTLPDNSAQLDVKSTVRGMLVPRMLAAQRTAISSPATGLIVYQTDGVDGFYYNKGTAAAPNWQFLGSSGANGYNSLIKTSAAPLA